MLLQVFLKVSIVWIDVRNLLLDAVRVLCCWIIRNILPDFLQVMGEAIEPRGGLRVLILRASSLPEGFPNLIEYLNRDNDIPSRPTEKRNNYFAIQVVPLKQGKPLAESCGTA